VVVKKIKRNPVIAIAGATGVVGTEMIAVIEQLKVPHSGVRLLASEDSAGEVYKVGADEVVVEKLADNSFDGVDVALFATSASLSEKYVPLAVEAGALAVDNSSHFRMQTGVPLVVPEVNFDAVTAETRLVANPNCSTIQLVPVLKALHKAAGLKRVVVSTYQSVSGAGKAALDELWSQTLAIFNQKPVEMEAFQHQIAFNCIPQIDLLMENGYTKEELKIINESRKILALPDLRITSTAVRVPVFHSHAESVNVETERPLSPKEAMEVLAKAQGVEVSPTGSYPMQLDTAGSDSVFVGRIRADESVPHGLNMWIVADNVRKGAALNAVQIVQEFLNKYGA
jgi:aspartate-semialdehyde dehydrogenase